MHGFTRQAADWHELMTPQRITRPSIARPSEQLDLQCSMQTYHRPISNARPSSVARKLLLIFRPAKGRRLSWPEHTVGWQLAQGCLQMAGSEIRTRNLKVTTPTLARDRKQRKVYLKGARQGRAASKTRKPSWRKGYARQQCVYTAILDFWNSKVAPLVRTSPKTLP